VPFLPRIHYFAVLGVWVCAAAQAAQPADLPRRHHAWGRFEPGAWKTVRVTSETLDERGVVASVSTSETTTRLLRLDDDRFTLRIETMMEVAGKRIVAEPQTVTQRYNGMPLDAPVERQSLPTEVLLIDGRRYECGVNELITQGASTRSVTRTWLSDAVSPFVLRRETTTTNLESQQTTGRSTLEVVALDMPFKAIDRTFSAAHLKSVQQHEKGSTVTLAITTLEVPGGVVAHTSKELDPEGRVVRRNTLELLDYGLPPTDDAGDDDDDSLRRPRMRRRRRVRDDAPPIRSRAFEARGGTAAPAASGDG
jgi:hypothetical protein